MKIPLDYDLIDNVLGKPTTPEEFKREYQCVFESVLDNGNGFIKVDRNGNVKHIPNSEIFIDKKNIKGN